MTETDGRSERNKLTAPIMQALPDTVERDHLFIAATGKSVSEHRRENGDMVPVEVLRAASDALPGFLAARGAEAEAEAEALAEAERRPAFGRLERIRRAILDGVGRTDRDEAATPEALAKAQAEADAEATHETLFEQGRREREKAAAALAKRQKAAIAHVRANLPVEPPELAELEAAATAAVDALRVAIHGYGEQVTAAKAALAGGGVVELPAFGGDVDAIDWDNHGHEHRTAVTIDGVLYSPETVAYRLSRVGQRATGSTVPLVATGVYEAARGDL